jgi:hypothetical protein
MFSRDFRKVLIYYNFMKISPVGAELYYADRQTAGQTDGQTDGHI